MPTCPDLPDPPDPPDPPWYELLPNSGALETAFEFLEGTFPHRYLHLNLPALRAKMRHCRSVPSPDDPKKSVLVPSLRAFIWKDDKGKPGIAAFFFLRFRFEIQAYCLSMGIDDDVVKTGLALRNELVEICKYMQGQDGISSIEIVNQRRIPEEENEEIPGGDDLEDTAASKIVRKAFQIACAPDANDRCQLSREEPINPGPPWPSELQRWILATL